MLPADEVAELREDEPAVDALGELAERGTGRAVVVEDGRLVGMLSRSDLARALQVGPRRRRRAR
jgi:CBS domain-containing protein